MNKIEPGKYPEHKEGLGCVSARRNVPVLLSMLVALVLVAGTWFIASIITDNRELAQNADQTAAAAQRSVKAAARAEDISDRITRIRRFHFARADYRACRIDEAQDAVLAGLLAVTLKGGRPPATQRERRIRDKFVATLADLEKGRNCANLPVLSSLSPQQRERILHPGR